jgi:predicted MFS family arabinose efflux permease
VAGPLLAGAALLTCFALWERHSPDAMIPPTLLRARNFAAASGIYLIAYTAFSGVLFYVTLLYQDVNGWSALHTGLSWLAMNIPFLAMAQLTGRLDRRFSTTLITTGCLAGGAGVLALSFATPTTPFVLTVVGYVMSGAGVGTLVPGITHVAMRDVPAGVSGAASGVVNASRQIGTSVGLAVLGSIGVGAAVSDWTAKAGRFPASIRVRALGQAQNVGGARIGAVSHTLGSAYRHPAAQSFVHGYHLAVIVGAACLLVAAVVAVIGFPTRPSRTAAPADQDGRRFPTSTPEMPSITQPR